MKVLHFAYALIDYIDSLVSNHCLLTHVAKPGLLEKFARYVCHQMLRALLHMKSKGFAHLGEEFYGENSAKRNFSGKF
jgi:hypothetical protein